MCIVYFAMYWMLKFAQYIVYSVLNIECPCYVHTCTNQLSRVFSSAYKHIPVFFCIFQFRNFQYQPTLSVLFHEIFCAILIFIEPVTFVKQLVLDAR